MREIVRHVISWSAPALAAGIFGWDLSTVSIWNHDSDVASVQTERAGCEATVDGVYCDRWNVTLTIVRRDGATRFGGRFPNLRYCSEAIDEIRKRRFFDSTTTIGDEKSHRESDGPTDYVGGSCGIS